MGISLVGSKIIFFLDYVFFLQKIYIVLVTNSMFMVTSVKKRKDTAVRVSKWLDKEIENYISDKKIRIEFPTKRNFIDVAVLQLLEEKKVLKK